MPFRFALDPVLRLRRSLEDRERLRLAVVVGAIGKLDAQCRRLDEEKVRIASGLRDSLRVGMLVGELQLRQGNAAKLKLAKNTLLAQRVKLVEQQAAQEEALRQAQRSRKTLESLRERNLAVYRMQQRRLEQQVVDDQFSVRRIFRKQLKAAQEDSSTAPLAPEALAAPESNGREEKQDGQP